MYSESELRPPRLGRKPLTQDVVRTFLGEYETWRSNFTEESGDGVVRRPCSVGKLTTIAQQRMLATLYFESRDISEEQTMKGSNKVADVY